MLFFVVFFFGIFSVFEAEAASYERLFYFREGANARKSFFTHPQDIDIFAPQSYQVDENNFLVGSVKADLLSFAKKNKIKVMPLLTNGAFHATTSRNFLDDIGKQITLINNFKVNK